jgi:GT2 family glycosyltransferase
VSFITEKNGRRELQTASLSPSASALSEQTALASELSNLDIVIVNWNAGKYLQKCITSLQSVHALDRGLIRTVTIVDNASSDDSLNLNNITDLSLRVIKNPTNLGFAVACNQGARDSIAPYILFLNPDAAVSIDTLRATVEYMRDPDHQKVGICGVKLIGDDGKTAASCSRFPSLRIYLADALGLAHFLPQYFEHQTMLEWPHDETRYVDQVMGAYFCIRAPLYHQLGGFDERFFVYSEEVDLSYRAYRSGYSSIFLSHVAAYHRGCVSSEQVKAKRLFYYLRSRMLYAFKHFNPASALIFAFATLCLEPVSRLVYALAHRSPRGVLETMKGFGYLWAWVPKYLLFGKTR